jgi:hypothetical protein
MHERRVWPLDEMGLVPVAAKERVELASRDPREHGEARDLRSVQVQDRKDRAVPGRVQELVRMPAGRERPRLGLAVSDDACHEQIRIVERGAVRVREAVAELSALVDRAGVPWAMRFDPTREGELLEQPAHSLEVARDVGIDLAVGPLEPGVRDETGPAVTRPRDVEHRKIASDDRAVQVRVDEVQPRGRAPVAEQARLDVVEGERLPEQRVVEQIDLADRKVVRRTPWRRVLGGSHFPRPPTRSAWRRGSRSEVRFALEQRS